MSSYPYDRVNAPCLVRYLFLIHKEKELKPAWKFEAYLKSAKALINKYGEENCKYAMIDIHKNVDLEHSFSFKFVENVILGTEGWENNVPGKARAKLF